MRSPWFGATVTGCLIVVAGGVLALGQPGKEAAPNQKPAGEGDAGEDVIALEAAPEAVRAAAVKLAGEAKNITAVIRERNKGGTTTFEIEYTEGAVKCAAILTVMGDVMQTERAVAESSVPASAMAALRREYPGATFAEAQAVTVHSYEIEVVIDGKRHEVKVDATGVVKDPSHMAGDRKAKTKEKKEKKEGKSKKNEHEVEGDDED